MNSKKLLVSHIVINGHVYGESVSVAAAIWLFVTVVVVCIGVCRDDPPFDTIKYKALSFDSFALLLCMRHSHIYSTHSTLRLILLDPFSVQQIHVYLV